MPHRTPSSIRLTVSSFTGSSIRPGRPCGRPVTSSARPTRDVPRSAVCPARLQYRRTPALRCATPAHPPDYRTNDRYYPNADQGSAQTGTGGPFASEWAAALARNPYPPLLTCRSRTCPTSRAFAAHDSVHVGAFTTALCGARHRRSRLPVKAAPPPELKAPSMQQPTPPTSTPAPLDQGDPIRK